MARIFRLGARRIALAAMLAACALGAMTAAAATYRRAWAVTWDLGSFFDQGASIASDNAGNVYVAGFVNESAYHLAKYTPAGLRLWTASIPTQHVFLVSFVNAHVAVDPSGYPILAGTLNAGDGTSLDYFVARFDPDGTRLWLQRFDANKDHDTVEALAVDAAGNIYVHGQGNGSGPRNVYTVKYDRDGTRLWTASYTPRDDLGCDIAIHTDGSVYALVSTTDYGTDDDIILIKYNASGTQQWLKRYNGGGTDFTDDWPSKLRLDGAGNAYLVGYSEATNGGGYGVVTQKYSAAGTLAWTRRFDPGGTSGGDFGYEPSGLVIDGNGQVYVSGRVQSPSGTGLDIVTIKYAADGTQLWAQTYTSTGSVNDAPRDLVQAPDGSLFVLAATSAGGFDSRLLLLRYSADGTLLSASVDPASKDGLMMAARGASIHIVGTSVFQNGYNVTVQKHSPATGRRRGVRH